MDLTDAGDGGGRDADQGTSVSGGLDDPANASGTPGDVQHQGAGDGLGKAGGVVGAFQNPA